MYRAYDFFDFIDAGIGEVQFILIRPDTKINNIITLKL